MLPYPAPYLARHMRLGSNPHPRRTANFWESLGSRNTPYPCTRGRNPSNTLVQTPSTIHQTEGNHWKNFRPPPLGYIPPLISPPVQGVKHTHPSEGETLGKFWATNRSGRPPYAPEGQQYLSPNRLVAQAPGVANEHPPPARFPP